MEGGLGGREVRVLVLSAAQVRVLLAVLEAGPSELVLAGRTEHDWTLQAVVLRREGVAIAQLLVSMPALSHDRLGGLFGESVLPELWRGLHDLSLDLEPR